MALLPVAVKFGMILMKAGYVAGKTLKVTKGIKAMTLIGTLAIGSVMGAQMQKAEDVTENIINSPRVKQVIAQEAKSPFQVVALDSDGAMVLKGKVKGNHIFWVKLDQQGEILQIDLYNEWGSLYQDSEVEKEVRTIVKKYKEG